MLFNVQKYRIIPRYYQITNPADTRGKYISKKNQDLAYQLAQKDYRQKLYQRAREELEDINRFLDKHGKADLENVYCGLNQYRNNRMLNQ